MVYLRADIVANGERFSTYGKIADAQGAKQMVEDKKTIVTPPWSSGFFDVPLFGTLASGNLTDSLRADKIAPLNNVLAEKREREIEIIENEFGEVSIDDAVLKKENMFLVEKTVALDNGDMCCTIRGDMTNWLKDILDEMHKGVVIDAILIEATDMADPELTVRTVRYSPVSTHELNPDGMMAMDDVQFARGAVRRD